MFVLEFSRCAIQPILFCWNLPELLLFKIDDQSHNTRTREASRILLIYRDHRGAQRELIQNWEDCLLACLCLILMNWKSSERENMISFQTAVQMFTSRIELRGNRFSLAFFVSLNVCLVLLIMLFNYRCLWEKQIKGKWWTIIDRLLIIVSQSYPRRRRRNIINGRYRIIGPIQIWIQPKWTRISLLASWHKLFDAFSWPFKLSTF